MQSSGILKNLQEIVPRQIQKSGKLPDLSPGSMEQEKSVFGDIIGRLVRKSVRFGRWIHFQLASGSMRGGSLQHPICKGLKRSFERGKLGFGVEIGGK